MLVSRESQAKLRAPRLVLLTVACRASAPAGPACWSHERYSEIDDRGRRRRLDIVDWIEGYYNRQRLHASIDFLAPVDYEASLIAA